jgi:hypothetical protein
MDMEVAQRARFAFGYGCRAVCAYKQQFAGKVPGCLCIQATVCWQTFYRAIAFIKTAASSLEIDASSTQPVDFTAIFAGLPFFPEPRRAGRRTEKRHARGGRHRRRRPMSRQFSLECRNFAAPPRAILTKIRRPILFDSFRFFRIY